MKIYKAPEKVNWELNPMSVFLAGSIEMGKAIDWQSVVTESFEDFDITVLNPRRDDWDSSWTQSIDNKNFNEQVTWELECQERADIIYMFFSAATKSPITLLELGLFRYKPMVVCCENGFWRKGNVEIVCDRYDIPLYSDLKESVFAISDFFDLYQNYHCINTQYKEVLNMIQEDSMFVEKQKKIGLNMKEKFKELRDE